MSSKLEGGRDVFVEASHLIHIRQRSLSYLTAAFRLVQIDIALALTIEIPNGQIG